METPSEWAKRFNQQKAGGVADVPKPEAPSKAGSASEGQFPNEPFSCPACGQFLGPSCAICVACKQPINPAEISRTSTPALPATPRPASANARPESVRYPWRILVVVMGIGMIVGMITFALLGDQKGTLVIQTLPFAVGFWVFFDAFNRRIPRPFRWGMGTMLLLALVFPWYLARRNRPESSVPFVEAETRPVTRVLFILLLVLFLLGVILNFRQVQPTASKPGSNSRAGISSRIASRAHADAIPRV